MTRFEREVMLQTARLTLATACVVADRVLRCGSPYPVPDYAGVLKDAKDAMTEWLLEQGRQVRESAADALRRSHG